MTTLQVVLNIDTSATPSLGFILQHVRNLLDRDPNYRVSYADIVELSEDDTYSLVP